MGATRVATGRSLD